MSQEPILLDSYKIKKNLIEYCLPITLEVLNTVDSTNDYLKNKKNTEHNHIHFCLAEQQTAGRGRLGRNWFSPSAANIYLSCRWPFNKDINELSGLSLVVGLTIIKALQQMQPSDEIKIKWPNDILWQEKKLAGILIGINVEKNLPTQAIIGIGLNVNMAAEQTTSIDQPWTSLQQIFAQPQDRNEIAVLLINQLLLELTLFAQQGFIPFLTEWQKHDVLCNKIIHLQYGEKKLSGIMHGINEQGHLLLKHPDGSIAAYSSGEVNIIKQ